MLTATAYLLAFAGRLISYLIYDWLQNDLRLIPGPTGWPVVGNILQLSPTRMHVQLYELAQKYGPVMKIYIFTKPVVVLNTADVIHEALIKRGTDFLGRPPMPRGTHILKTDIVFTSSDDPMHTLLRKVGSKALRTYGQGVAKMEKIMLDVLQDLIEDMDSSAGQPLVVNDMCLSFVSCAMHTLVYGEKQALNDPEITQLHEMNEMMKDALHQVKNDPIIDLYPALFKLRKILFCKTDELLGKIDDELAAHILPKIAEAKESFDEDQLRGCLDHFIKAQKEEVDENGNPLIDDGCIQGLMLDFITGGMETSLSSLCQAFLDFLHDPKLMKRIQAEIDTNFESGQVITLHDRVKLPLLEAYIHENLRNLSQAALMLPHYTLRDSDVGGYKIPAGTRVIMNNFSASHNPAAYPDPFECKPERFLDDEGKLVPPGHSARYNSVGFGMGRRGCPGELLARSRIFLFLAGILQKFDIEPADELPDRDVRNYPLSVIVEPPEFKAKFSLRKSVD